MGILQAIIGIVVQVDLQAIAIMAILGQVNNVNDHCWSTCTTIPIIAFSMPTIMVHYIDTFSHKN